jgi:hypothetical protein
MLTCKSFRQTLYINFDFIDVGEYLQVFLINTASMGNMRGNMSEILDQRAMDRWIEDNKISRRVPKVRFKLYSEQASEFKHRRSSQFHWGFLVVSLNELSGTVLN